MRKIFFITGLIALSFIAGCGQQAPVPSNQGNTAMPLTGETSKQTAATVTVVPSTQATSGEGVNTQAAANVPGTAVEVKTGTAAEGKNISVKSPLIGDLVKSPLTVKGTAENWYFEGTFPVKLFDDAGNVLATGQAKALTDWTKGGKIDFEAKLEFEPGKAVKGNLLLEKDNPSGLLQMAASISVPVRFK